MDLRQIQYFICLYEEKSVTRAAKRLNIVQPALSMQITRLEIEVGRPLFTRTPRGMTPTPVADEMYSLFLPILGAFNTAKSKIVHDGKDLSGHVRVGVISCIGQSVLAEVLAQFTTEHPNVTLSVTEGLTDDLCNRVTQGDLDLAFVNQPARRSTLDQGFVMREEIVVACSPERGVELTEHVTLEQLLAYQLILPTHSHGIRYLLDDYARRFGIKLLPALELDSIMAQALMISHGPYVGFFGRSTLENLINHAGLKLRMHQLRNNSLSRDLVYVCDTQRPPQAAASALTAALVSALRRVDQTATGAEPSSPLQVAL